MFFHCSYDARDALMQLDHDYRRRLQEDRLENIQKPRITFEHHRSPARLLIHRARMSDAGIYECRVDFKTTPSSTTYIQVSAQLTLKPLIQTQFIYHHHHNHIFINKITQFCQATRKL